MVYESVVKAQLMRQLESDNLLSEPQHGLRQGKSTMTAMSGMVGGIILKGLSRVNRRPRYSINMTCLRHCTVSHNILLIKISRYFISGLILEIFRSISLERYGYKFCLRVSKLSPNQVIK